jgi:hypothetical protein
LQAHYSWHGHSQRQREKEVIRKRLLVCQFAI